MYVHKIYTNLNTGIEFQINSSNLKSSKCWLGNSLVFAYTILLGWAATNSVHLQDENSTFATGSLSLQEVSLIISIVFVGCLIGNFVVIPSVQLIGPKRTIHLSSIPLIVFIKNIFLSINGCDINIHFILVGCFVDNLRTKHLLFVCIKNFNRFGCRWRAVFNFYTNKWDWFQSVSTSLWFSTSSNLFF